MEFIRENFKEANLKEINLKKVGELAYKFYWDYNCEYGVITAFNLACNFKPEYPEVKAFTPLLPNKWSRICGAITGALWVFSLTLEREDFERAVKELFKFHNETPLPIFKGALKLPKAPALSVVCRDSIINWCSATKIHPRSPERSYRCAAITADVAIKCGQIVRELSPVR